jgi:hypothetical protein
MTLPLLKAEKTWVSGTLPGGGVCNPATSAAGYAGGVHQTFSALRQEARGTRRLCIRRNQKEPKAFKENDQSSPWARSRHR